MKKWITIITLMFVSYISIYLLQNYSPIDALEIQGSSLEMQIGETVQLDVKGYKYQNDGEIKKEIDINNSKITWNVRSFDDAIRISEEGMLEAVKEGDGTVQAIYNDNIGSRPITVSVDNNEDDEAFDDYMNEGISFLNELDDTDIVLWINENFNSTYNDLFSKYNGSIIQRIASEKQLNYSPAVCPDIVYYKTSEKDLNAIVSKMIDEMMLPLTKKDTEQSYQILSYTVEKQEILPFKENVWILPMINVYYRYAGTDLVTLETYIKNESELLKNDMMPLMRQGDDSAFVYILVEKDGVYRLQRALDMKEDTER